MADTAINIKKQKTKAVQKQKNRQIVVDGGAIIKYIGYLALLVLLANAQITDNIIPFAFGMFVALLLTNRNSSVVLAFIYSAAVLVNNFSVYTMLTACLPSMVFAAVYSFIRAANKKLNGLVLTLLILLCYVPSVVYKTDGVSLLYEKAAAAIIGTIFCFVSIHIVRALHCRGLKYKLNIDEVICACIVLMAVSLGMAPIKLFGIEIIRTVAVMSLLLCAFTFDIGYTLTLAAVLGFGASFSTQNLSFIAAFVVYALIIFCFKDLNRYLTAASVILIDLLLGYFFEVYGSYSTALILSNAIGAAAFMLVPKAVLLKLSDNIGGKKEKYIARHIINRNRQTIGNRLYEMSEVFGEMERVFKSMVKGVASAENCRDALVTETVEKTCSDCPEKNKCWRARLHETEEAFIQIIGSGIEKGRVTLLDINNYITTHCTRINSLLSNANQLLNQLKQYNTLTTNMNASRMLIGQQLGGVSKIMKTLAGQTNQNVSFNLQLERKIVEDLTYANIVCREAILYGENNTDNCNLSLLVRNNDAYNEELSHIVSSSINQKMMVVDRESSKHNGWTVVYLKPSPMFDVVFGQCGCVKSGNSVSGDTHSLIRISEDKFMLAICDGMGSGKAAETTSTTAISMIENFYKAGFDNDIILSSVNKLLSINAEETFVALDVCVVDLKRGICDFVKLGSPQSFIKNRENTEIINGGALPLGVLDSVHPVISKKIISINSMIILCTDGIIDSFQNPAQLKQLIETLDTANPQTAADKILQAALANDNNAPKDDMTVVVARIIPKNAI